MAILLLVVLATGCASPVAISALADGPATATASVLSGNGVQSSPLSTPTLSANDNDASAVTIQATSTVSATLAPAAELPTSTPRPAQPAVTLPTPTPKPASEPTSPVISPTVSPQSTPDDAPRSVRAPILMYHYLSAPPPGADIYRQDLSVTPELFAAHLDRIKAEGYQTITLYDLLLHLTQGAPLPEKPVVITFDDGYRDNYENAFPLLKERGMTATFFVVTDFIDEERPAYLSWEMAREMHDAGMDIESHGRNHVSLKGKDNDYLVWQALGSLETIEYEIGERPRFISYPAGEYDQATIDILRSANYWAGLTTRQGATHSLDAPFEWKRVRVRGSTTPDDLVNLLALDW